jgi:hypothetical protein
MLNHILKALGPDDGARISANLELVTLSARQQLETPSRPIGHVYFFETGVAAVMSVSNRRRPLSACHGHAERGHGGTDCRALASQHHE